LKTHLTRHLAKAHGIYPLDSKMKVKTPFVMVSTPLMKATRQICKNAIKLKHFCRSPTDIVDSNKIKAEGIV